MKKQTMPDGWVRITWEDPQGKKWHDNMPIATIGHFELNLLSKGGQIVRMEY